MRSPCVYASIIYCMCVCVWVYQNNMLKMILLYISRMMERKKKYLNNLIFPSPPFHRSLSPPPNNLFLSEREMETHCIASLRTFASYITHGIPLLRKFHLRAHVAGTVSLFPTYRYIKIILVYDWNS